MLLQLGAVCLQAFAASVSVRSEVDRPVRMVRGCHRHCGGRTQHTLAYAGRQVFPVYEMVHVVPERSLDVRLIGTMISLPRSPCCSNTSIITQLYTNRLLYELRFVFYIGVMT